ncbi:hypothetical protein JOF53_004690 [Crossiella equi]|uniref:Uncharacterized protein n=1 Tax=Crossiella equi TaxID=130796 RepID=A0ABS5AGW5_9PSEU|nr:hypothetical protein [Crossiella equi]MBP2475818.1 hypothetical protein [Crossiella equi]
MEQLRSVLAVEPPPPTVSCADVMRDGRRAVRRRRFGVAAVVLAAVTVLGSGTVLLMPEPPVPVANTVPVPPAPTKPPRPALTIADAERFSVHFFKTGWLGTPLSLAGDSPGEPGQFRLIEDYLRLGLKLTDQQGHTGHLAVTIRYGDGQVRSCAPVDGCKVEQVPEGRQYSLPRRDAAASAQRELLLVTPEGLEISAVLTEGQSWPMLTGADLNRLVTGLAQSSQR